MAAPYLSVENRVVLFTDIHDFSVLMAGREHAQAAFLQAVYERLGDIIVAHGGEILKYMGDALLCLFSGGSEPTAVQCAIELRRAFARLLAERQLPPGSELEVGIGSGPVVTGIFGHRSLRVRDVLGDEVNRTAIIGHHRGIAVTESVCQQIRSRYPTRELPAVSVKWQQEPLRVWEVVVAGEADR